MFYDIKFNIIILNLKTAYLNNFFVNQYFNEKVYHVIYFRKIWHWCIKSVEKKSIVVKNAFNNLESI